MRYQIPVCILEFDEGGHTLWVQSPEGATVLRLKTLGGKIEVSHGCQNPVAHVDIMTTGNIEICIRERKKHE